MSPNDTEYIDPSQLYMDSFIYLEILQVQIFVQHGPRTNATLPCRATLPRRLHPILCVLESIKLTLLFPPYVAVSGTPS